MLVATVFAGAAGAEEGPRPETPVRTSIDVDVDVGPRTAAAAPRPALEWVLGASLTSAAEYPGADERKLSMRPLLGVRYGRLRLSSSGSGAIMNFGTLADDAGASLEWIESDRWSFKTGLRYGGGRSTAASDRLAGLPDTPKTVFGRFTASYRLGPHWRASSGLTIDLLGRGNGVVLTPGIDYRTRLGPTTEFTAGVGLGIASATHMMNFHGVPVDATTAVRPAYRPGSGLRDAGIGLGLMTTLTPSWVAYGQIGYSRLLGPAADSPLTLRAGSVTATIGLAWRCCR